MTRIIFLTEALRIFSRRIRVALHGIKRYRGDSLLICNDIIRDCYDKKLGYFRVSTGHFCQFYARDFGWVCESLLKLGYNDEVRNTLRYALRRYKISGHITVAISPSGKCFDFPNYAVDSLPYIIYALSVLKDKRLVEEYREFLIDEIEFFKRMVLDRKTGNVRPDKTFSSMKDHSVRISSCYDLCMLYLLQKSCHSLSIVSGLERYDYLKLIMEKYWTGKYFLDDLSGKRYIAGDANVFPFWVNLVKDRKLLKITMTTLMTESLDEPIPLRYTKRSANIRLNIFDCFASEYERDTCWMHMGMLYVSLWKNLDNARFKRYMEIYKKNIEKNRNYLELFHPDGKPFRTLLYYSDESMIWSANYLALFRKAKSGFLGY